MAVPKKYRNWEKLGKAAGGEKWFTVCGQAIYGSPSMFASLPKIMIDTDCPVEGSDVELFNGYPVDSMDYVPYPCQPFSLKGVADYLPAVVATDEVDWMNTVLFKDNFLWVTDNEMCLQIACPVEQTELLFVIPRDAAKVLKSATSDIVAIRKDDLQVTLEFLDQSRFTFKLVKNKWIDMSGWFQGWNDLSRLREVVVDKLLGIVDRNGAKFVSFDGKNANVVDKDGAVFYSDPFDGIDIGDNSAVTFPVKSFKKLLKMIRSGDFGELEPEFSVSYYPYPARFRFCDKQGRIVQGLLNCAGA